jgi:hypothetical protein
MGACYSMLTDRWTDNYYEPITHFLEMCELPDLVYFVIHENYSQDTDLRLLESIGQCLIMT